MSRYDGLIIPRSYSEYINKTDAATLSQALQLGGVLDSAPTEDSVKAVKSGGVFDALAGKQPALTFDNVPTEDSDNPVKSGGIYDALATKQDTLTFDNAPTEDSNNPVKSGGVKSALNNALNYSELETDTGTKWVNGKTIYKKVLYKNQSLNIGNTTIDVSGDNLTAIDTLVNAKIVRQKNAGVTTVVLFYPVRYSQSDNTLIVYGGNISWDGPIYIVLEYTKTS